MNAPYIDRAERFGVEIPPEIYCPCCGNPCKTIYAKGPEPLGCEVCVDVMDSDEWYREGE